VLGTLQGQNARIVGRYVGPNLDPDPYFLLRAVLLLSDPPGQPPVDGKDVCLVMVKCGSGLLDIKKKLVIAQGQSEDLTWAWALCEKIEVVR
jgi:hypothetical protein